MSLDTRLNRLMPTLTARERAVLVLRSWKDGTPEDLAWRSSMPAQQVREFNRLIDLMNACSVKLSPVILVVCKDVEMLQVYGAWLTTLEMWQLNLAEVEYLAALVAREAVTESEHRRLVDRVAGVYLRVDQLAVELAEERRYWTDDDLEEVPWVPGLVVKDGAWQRLCADAEADIRAAARAGLLVAKGKGKSLKVRRDSFDAWLGRPVKPLPSWAAGYDVQPDSRGPNVAADRTSLAQLREVLSEAPFARLLRGEDAEPEEGDRSIEHLAQAPRGRLSRGVDLRWRELRAVEVVVEEASEEFGEDALRPSLRRIVEETKEKLTHLAWECGVHGCDVELREPEEEELELMRGLVARGRPLG